GESCTVRAAFDTITNKHMALKIIDISFEYINAEKSEIIKESTRQEVEILKKCQDNEFI
ncbi:MAG: Phosphorylase b kinase gamma catalytic chain, skeletal muscle/heart isoform, partial [Paramarteilia canceri]